MYRFLLRPKWIAATLGVITLSIVFTSLGFWQLARKQERATLNAVTSARMNQDPLPVESLLAAVGDDLTSLEYRSATATGTYLPEDELLVRNRTDENGVAGFHVLTPLRLDDGSLLIVNRGWVPLEMDTPPVAAPPPDGEVTVTGILRLSEHRSAVGPTDPPGDIVVFNRIDLDRIDQLGLGTIAPVWLEITEATSSLPVPLPLPDVNDPGPHLSYAIQWFSFAAIAVVGYVIGIRRTANPRRRHLPPVD